MISWFGYDDEGTLRSVETHLHGWPPNVDFMTDPMTADTRTSRAAGGITKFVSYNCPCPRTADDCMCHNLRLGDAYVINGSLTMKPDIHATVNGSGTYRGPKHQLTVPRGDVKIDLVGLTDGAEVTVSYRRGPGAPPDQQLVAANGGVSFIVPAASLQSTTWLRTSGKLVRSMMFMLTPE